MPLQRRYGLGPQSGHRRRGICTQQLLWWQVALACIVCATCTLAVATMFPCRAVATAAPCSIYGIASAEARAQLHGVAYSVPMMAFDAQDVVTERRREPLRVYGAKDVLRDPGGHPVDMVVPLRTLQCVTVQVVQRLNTIHRPRLIWIISAHEQTCNVAATLAPNVRCVSVDQVRSPPRA